MPEEATSPELAPGKLGSRGALTDQADAEAVWRYVQLCRKEPDISLRGRILTEAIWFKWEAPRIPEPHKAKKYSLAYPWSADARQRLSEGRTGGLVIEHVYPKRFLKADLLAAENVAQVHALLAERLLHAVITTSEHRRLTADGDSWDRFVVDPWLRYRAAWPELEGFLVPARARD